MKKLFFLSVIVSFLITSCNEIMPTIPPLGNPEIIPIDTSVANRKVLIEEFTGVKCVNCPAGSKEIETLLGRNSNNLIAISIHAGFFSKPYPDSKYDFNTEDGDDLVNIYFGGEPFAYPSATINRQKNSNNSFYVTSQEWAGAIASEIQEEVQVTLDLEHSFDEANRGLNLDVTVNPKIAIPNDLRISVMISESKIEDYQLQPDPDGLTPDYEHNHVLRTIITPFDGEIVSGQELTPGNPVKKSFSFTLPDEWSPENCNVIALVHRNTADSKEVLNAEEAHVIE